MHSAPLVSSLPYHPQSAQWFTRLRHLPFAVWLDSGRPNSQYGRFDIISAAPRTWLETHGSNTRITYIDGSSISSTADPFQLLQQHLSPLQQPVRCGHLPFYGGALGYFAYDLARRLEKLPALTTQDIRLPDMNIGIYPWAIVQDHELKEAWLIKNHALDGAYNFSEIDTICDAAVKNPVFHDLTSFIGKKKNVFKINRFESNIHVAQYRAALTKIHHYIRAGDCYQVNFAQRFSTKFTGDPFIAYNALREALPSPFSGFMQLPQGAVLSLSPERFIQVRDKQVETKPIKGTIKRGITPTEDIRNAEWLKNSPKDRAENVMIVDLLRNDLSKHCNKVRVPELCELQTFANVHHLVSTVTAELKPAAHCIDVLRDSFPGGSITGAPKIRAMEIIEELEPTRRSLYCGSLGYISIDGQMDTSIAIRTLVCDGDNMHCWGGGGIVADSDIDKEYQESIAKVDVLMRTLEQKFGPTNDSQ